MEAVTPERRLIEWTGERCVPWADDLQVVYEHLHRYLFASELVRGKDVLDLASGEGYGSQILAESARTVLGVEIDESAVEHARLRYHGENLHFRHGSALELDDLPAGSFDVVVCFEFIEHIAEHEQLLAGVTRLLRSDGRLVISTPDRDAYTSGSGQGNPYHVRELTRVEFGRLLRASFPHAAMWAQSGSVRSAMWRLRDDAADAVAHEDAGDQEFGVDRSGDRWLHHRGHAAPYLVAVASRTPLPPLPRLSTLTSALVPESQASARVPESQAGTDPPDGLFELWDVERLRRQVMIYEAALLQETDAREQAEAGHREAAEEVRRLTDVVNRLAVEANRYQNAAMGFEAQVDALRADVDTLQSELDTIKGSRAWSALSAYRRLRHRLPSSPSAPAGR